MLKKTTSLIKTIFVTIISKYHLESLYFEHLCKPLFDKKTRKFLVNGSNKNKDYLVQNKNTVKQFFFPDRKLLPGDIEMPMMEHIEELRERVFLAACAVMLSIIVCFCFSKELIFFLEAPVAKQGVRFLQLSPGEFFFTTIKVSGYTGLLVSMPTILYQVGAWIKPGNLTYSLNIIRS